MFSQMTQPTPLLAFLLLGGVVIVRGASVLFFGFGLGLLVLPRNGPSLKPLFCAEGTRQGIATEHPRGSDQG